MATVFQPTVFQPVVFQIVVATGGARPTGGIEWWAHVPHKRRAEDAPVAVIEIDGQRTQVANAQETAHALGRIREVARAVARKAVPDARIEPAAPVVRVVSQTPNMSQLQAQVDAANARLRAIYARAWQQRRDDEDEDDAIVLLM